MNNGDNDLTLLQLQLELRDAVARCHAAQTAWIHAELSDVRQSGGHCYMELLEKDDATGQTLAKARATIWANVWRKISLQFRNATGRDFASGLKVRVQVSAGYHPVYGMNLNITAIDPSYTMGERERKRREILQRLKNEGVIDYNKQLQFPRPTQRIAVISSATAAGYGDFMNQLLHNPRHLKFKTQLFPAIVQGDQTADSVIAQLEAIAANIDDYDCVCIIRGGGASTDLDGFDDYRLALNVAQFPLPVIVGIGHERDTTVLDYIACQRVKTPTAAAEFLLGLGQQELDNILGIGAALLQTVTDALAGGQQQLAYIAGALPSAPHAAIERAGRRIDNLASALGRISSTRLQPLQSRLDRLADALKNSAANTLRHASTKLSGYESLIDALSPKATLRRGFSVTRINGAAITSTDNVAPGAVLETELANGTIISTVK